MKITFCKSFIAEPSYFSVASPAWGSRVRSGIYRCLKKPQSAAGSAES